jgi:hypothetical protein
MKPAEFPKYQNAEIASHWGCFQCLKPLNPETVKDDGYSEGRGRYCIKCNHCQMTIWFDLWDKSGNPIKGESP